MKFVFEKDYGELLKLCGGDEDLAMDVVVSSLESEQKHRPRSISKELTIQLERRVNSKDVMDILVTESLDEEMMDLSDDYFTYNHPDEGLLYEILDRLSTLTDREIRVLFYRFFKGFDLKRTGLEFNLSGSRIRQIECKALNKLRHPSRINGLQDYIEEVDSESGIYYDDMDISDFHELIDMAWKYKNRSKPRSVIKKKTTKKRHRSSVKVSMFCKKLEDYLLYGPSMEEPRSFDREEQMRIKKDIFTDIDGFVNSLDMCPLPSVIKRSIRLSLIEIANRYTDLSKVHDLIHLLYFKNSDLTNFERLRSIICCICEITQNKITYTRNFNEKDGGWMEYYDHRRYHNFSAESVPFNNIPDELQLILIMGSYAYHYKKHGPVFSDKEDLLLFSLYYDNEKANHCDSLIEYFKNKYYAGLDISEWSICDDEHYNQYMLNSLYRELDHYKFIDRLKFPVIGNVKLTAEKLEENALNFVDIKGRCILYKSIYPKEYTRSVLLGYYHSMIFIHRMKYTNIEAKFGIPVGDISKNSDSFDIEDKKKIAMISSVFIWAYNNIPIEFSTEDFWKIYNSENFEYKLDVIVSCVENAFRYSEDHDVLSTAIKIINSII